MDCNITSDYENKKLKFLYTICRLCSTECELNSKSIFQEKIIEMVDFCFFLCPTQTDGLPKRVCLSCLQSLKTSYLFKVQVETTNTMLKEKLKNFISKQDILDIALNDAEIKSVPKHHTIDDVSTFKTKELETEENSSKVEILELNEDEIRKETDIPSLVPIQLENFEKTALEKNLTQEPPPLLPLKPVKNKSEKHETKFTSEKLSKNKLGCDSLKSIFCNICRKEFKDNKKLIGHLKGHMVPKNFACKICEKKYPNPSTFQIHMRSHTGERPFRCPVCDKGFTRWAGVVSHMQTHEDNRPFKCDSCDQSFKILSNLERHKVLHSEVLPFCCNYCGKTFSQSANLQLHIRTYHTNERPYLCSECGKGFVSSTRLNRHMWVHSGYKPFLCKICSKAYSNSGDLRNHESCAHGDGECKKPYACTLCDKRFFYSCRLSKHLKTHQRPYTCDQCNKSFTSSNILEQHTRSKHSNVDPVDNKLN